MAKTSKPLRDIEPNASLVPQSVADAYAAARDKAADAIEGVSANPLVALLSGLALGAAVGGLIPRGEREKALLSPLGTRIGDAAAAAIAAGREAGTQALDDQGLSLDGLRDQAAKLFGALTDVAGTAAAEALKAGKAKVQS